MPVIFAPKQITQGQLVEQAQAWIKKQEHWSEPKKVYANRYLLRYYLQNGLALTFSQWMDWSIKFDDMMKEVKNDDKAK